MKTFAGIITSCIFASFLLVSPSAFADRPALGDRGATPLPPPNFSNDESTGPMGDAMDASRPENTMTESLAEPEAEAVMQETEISSEQTIGDTVEVQTGETMPVHLLDFPRRGMSMDKVKNELGQPLQIAPTVGEPPITSWAYDDRTVYFEYSTVIHVVATK